MKYIRINDMTWPLPCDDMDDIAYDLRYNILDDRHDMVAAAEIIAAYCQMINDPIKKRQMVIREIRKEMK